MKPLHRGIRGILGLLLLGSSSVIHAGDEPAVGTRIIGDEEAALGLNITPWQEESVDRLDRPPLLLAPTAGDVDANELRQRVHLQQTISAYRRSNVDPR